MARKKNKLFGWVVWLTGVLTSVGIGGLFINGTFLNTSLLSWMGQLVHQIVGWVIIGSTAWALFQKFIK